MSVSFRVEADYQIIGEMKLLQDNVLKIKSKLILDKTKIKSDLRCVVTTKIIPEPMKVLII